MLIKYNYKNHIDNSKIVNDLKKGQKIILIENFPLTDIDIQSFINNIGDSIIEFRNNNKQDVFNVKISKQNKFFRSIANSNLNFPLHTDCADFESIPNCIGLLCVNPAISNQGTSTFSFLKDSLKKISEEDIQILSSKKWKFRNQKRSILNFKHNQYTICYDRITLESFSNLNNQDINILNKLDGIFNNNSFKLKLKKGDFILFRNDLTLHGRTKIDLNSDRLIKRIRFNLQQ